MCAVQICAWCICVHGVYVCGAHKYMVHISTWCTYVHGACVCACVCVLHMKGAHIM